jgi:hypothetical protein
MQLHQSTMDQALGLDHCQSGRGFIGVEQELPEWKSNTGFQKTLLPWRGPPPFT